MAETNENPEGITIKQTAEAISVCIQKESTISHLEVELKPKAESSPEKILKVTVNRTLMRHIVLHAVINLLTTAVITAGVVITIWRLTR